MGEHGLAGGDDRAGSIGPPGWAEPPATFGPARGGSATPTPELPGGWAPAPSPEPPGGWLPPAGAAQVGEAPQRALNARVLSWIVDVVVLFVAGVVVGVVAPATARHVWTHHWSYRLLFTVVALAYFGVLEAAFGQTIGKRVCGICVARRGDAGRAGAGAILARTLLRPVDGFPFGLVGLLTISRTGPTRRQRVGDIAAETVVVRVADAGADAPRGSDGALFGVAAALSVGLTLLLMAVWPSFGA